MKERIFESNAKYVSKFNHELAGRTFHLVMDNGREYVASFISGEIVLWAEQGDPFRWEKYQCLKSDDTTYLVVMELYGQPLRTCRTLVLDLEQSLVTMHVARQGGIPHRPRMVEVEFLFGAIKLPGQTPPVKRHCYTTDLVNPGPGVRGVDGGQSFNLVHVYPDQIVHSIVPIGDYRTVYQVDVTAEELAQFATLSPEEQRDVMLARDPSA